VHENLAVNNYAAKNIFAGSAPVIKHNSNFISKYLLRKLVDRGERLGV
jgi:hypothetical protein